MAIASVLCALLLLAISGDHLLVVNGSRLPRSQQPRLQILPGAEGGVLSRAVNKPFNLNCFGADGDPRLFSDLTWFDPNGRKVDRAMANNEKLILTFMSLTMNDAGTYRCEGVFQNTIKLSASIKLSVHEGVTWKDCPEVQAIVKGSSQDKVRCTASANPRPDITWVKDGVPLDTQRYAADNNGITIKGMSREDDAGEYEVMATVMETGQLERRVIRVEVHVRPQIDELKEEYEVIEGEQATLACHAAATPHAYYSWLDNEKRNLSSVQGYMVNRDSGDLIIANVAKRDDGAFTCTAENAAGADQKVTDVNVLTKPSVTSFGNTSVPEGQEAHMTCVATGNPPPSLKVRRQGEGQTPLFSGQSRINIEERQDGDRTTLSLHINDLQKSDDGLYYCAAENKAGRVERAGHIEVQFKPDLSRNPNVVKAWANQRANISCVAYAIPNATIQWFVQGQTILPGERYRIFGSSGTSNLEVHPLNGVSVYGEYRCLAYNNHGKSDIYIKLVEAFPPHPITLARVESRTPQSISFSFEGPPDDGGMPIIRYHVIYEEVDGGVSGIQQKKTWPAGGNNVFSVNGLSAKTTYRFRFAAENAVGTGAFAADVHQQLPSESHPERPLIRTADLAKDAQSGDILSQHSNYYPLQWSAPADNGRAITSYDIKYYKVRRSGGGEWIQEGAEVMETITAANELHYSLENLEPSSFYRVELTAKNSLGNSMPAYLVFRTAERRGDGTLSDSGGAQGAFISDASLGTIIQILIGLAITTAVIIDLVLCLGFRKGLLHCLFVAWWASSSSSARSDSSSSESVTDLKQKPGDESPVNIERPKIISDV